MLFTVPDAQGNRNVTLANPTMTDPRKTYPLTVRKVAKDDNTVRVNGAVFDLLQGDHRQQHAEPRRRRRHEGRQLHHAGNGECTVSNLAWGEKYYWYEVSVPAPYNLPSNRVVGPITINADGSTSPSGTSVFEDPPVEDRDAGDERIRCRTATISDTATLSGAQQQRQRQR